MPRIPGRRNVLAGLLAAFAVPQVPVLAAQHSEARLSALKSALLEACGGAKVPAELARACIDECPKTVLSRTTAQLGASFEHAVASGLNFDEWLRQQTVADFSAARVVHVHGWVISETEFLLFARLGASA